MPNAVRQGINESNFLKISVCKYLFCKPLVEFNEFGLYGDKTVLGDLYREKWGCAEVKFLRQEKPEYRVYATDFLCTYFFRA